MVRLGLALGALLLGTVIAGRLLRRRLSSSRQRLKLPGAEPDSRRSGDALHQIEVELERRLDHVSQHNEYLEKMASRLNHELRTPVSVVKSSLENLEGTISGDSEVYVERALEGVRRLTLILNKMSEARRLEESLDEEEVVRLDFSAVVNGCVEGYRLAFNEYRFSLSIEDEEIPVTGIPELLAQLMDKLIDNAVEFSTADEIRIRLNIENGRVKLRVMNQGPVLPESGAASLFDSMVSVRDSGSPVNRQGMHLGLGLYVAKLIAEFHGGRLEIANREDVQGVMVLLELPLLRITAKLR